ncbi:SGNH/GDSL hydrolase family protein [Calidifontibacter terrae]
MGTTGRKGAIGAAVIAAGTLVVAPVSAASNSYVALGDSYSAGVGSKASNGTSCYRSTYGYPALLAAAKGLALSYQACSGATTADVVNNQIGALSSTTAYVTITIGGNDLGFADVLTECAQPAWMSDCSGAIATGRSVLTGQLPARYDSLFTAIRSKAPNARVVVATYPRIFNGEDCNAFTWFSPGEETSLNTATDDLDSLVLTKAKDHGFQTVDVRSPFNTHRVCDSVEWINGLSNPIVESYHPNRTGHAAYASAISPVLLGSTFKAAAVAPQRVQPAAAPEPQVDLMSPASVAGAKKVGIALSELQRLNTELHSGDAHRMQAAATRVAQLDKMAMVKLGRR